MRGIKLSELIHSIFFFLVKVCRPSYIPFCGETKIEKHVPLFMVIDVIIEQGTNKGLIYKASCVILFALLSHIIAIGAQTCIYSFNPTAILLISLCFQKQVTSV